MNLYLLLYLSKSYKIKNKFKYQGCFIIESNITEDKYIGYSYNNCSNVINKLLISEKKNKIKIIIPNLDKVLIKIIRSKLIIVYNYKKI